MRHLDKTADKQWDTSRPAVFFTSIPLCHSCSGPETSLKAILNKALKIWTAFSGKQSLSSSFHLFSPDMRNWPSQSTRAEWLLLKFTALLRSQALLPTHKTNEVLQARYLFHKQENVGHSLAASLSWSEKKRPNPAATQHFQQTGKAGIIY